MGSSRQPIAVVGMALRVPGAGTPEAFWRNLVAGRDCLTRLSDTVLRRQGVPHRVLSDPRFVAARPMLQDIEYFDAGYFDMTSFEAETTDPVHRLFLECASEALERAAVPAGGRAHATGVFAGVEGDYGRANLRPISDPRDVGVGLPVRLGTETEFSAARVSYKLNLTGPSFAVEAACATSLLAVHLAAHSLRLGECDFALAGGGTVLLPQEAGYLASFDGMLSSSGRIHAFDARADGTVFGSGVGVVVLCTLERALAEGHHIHAVLLGSGASNDGGPESKESFVAPDQAGQAAAIAGALADAAVDPSTIGYVEAHGTGTRLGDPVEIGSLTEVYRRHTSERGYCAIGSVKSNVGHLRNGAGVVSFIKACLALEHAVLPPAANFERPNPLIDFDSSPFFINTEPIDWAESSNPRRAAVSAFGFGGCNAHTILQEYVEAGRAARPAAGPVLLPLSARSPAALERQVAELSSVLQARPDLDPGDVSHTLQQRRRWKYAACLLAPGAGPGVLDPLEVRGTAEPGDHPVVFLFPGQGAQRPGMGRQLYATEAVYRETVDLCASRLMPELGFDVRELVHRDPRGVEQDRSGLLRQTIHAQPALFVVEYALARLFESWGVRPDAMLGHSVGELVAACLAGVFGLDDGLRLVAARARIMQQCETGSMLAVLMPVEDVERILPETLDIAAVNAPVLTVVSGPHASIDGFAAYLTKRGFDHRRVETSHAFHSRMMDRCLDEFGDVVAGVTLHAPGRTVISNLDGMPLTPERATDPGYWTQHMRRPVLFSAGVSRLLESSRPVFVEVGPGTTLRDLVRRHDRDVAATASMDVDASTGEAEQRAVLRALGRMWCAGVAVDWQSRVEGRAHRKLILPTYPYQRSRYWYGTSGPEYGRILNLYEHSWEKTRPIEPGADEAAPPPRSWLVFRDRLAVADSMVEVLRSTGERVATVTPGDDCQRLEPAGWAIRPGSREDLLAVLGSLEPGVPVRALHLWGVTGADGAHNDTDAFEQAVRDGYATLLALVQAAYELGVADSLEVLVIADGLQLVNDEPGPMHSEKSVMLGPCRVVPQEVPGLAMRAVDIPVTEGGRVPEWLLPGLLAEARAWEPGPTVTAIRPDGRYQEQIAVLPEPLVTRPRLRDQGTVLITGGLGALGLQVAGLLFDLAGARLVLVARTGLPPRERWATADLKDDHRGRAIGKLLELEGRGAELLVLQADVADYQSLESAVTRARERFGEIHGVVHAAGVIEDSSSLVKTSVESERVFAGKVRGAYNLERLFSGAALDLVILFSSRASIRPAPGQVDYSAANSVLNALAHRRRRSATGLCCAIGWGAWQEAGMAAQTGSAGRPRGSAEDIERPAAPTRPLDHPLIQQRLATAGGGVAYRGSVHPSRHWMLDDHRLGGCPLMSATTIIDCLYTAFSDYRGTGRVELTGLVFMRPLFVDDDGADIEIAFAAQGEDESSFTVSSRSPGAGGEWVVNAVGYARAPAAGGDDRAVDPAAYPGPDEPATGANLSNERWRFGPRWRCLRASRIDNGETRARLRLPAGAEADAGTFGVHPVLLDLGLTCSADRFYTDSVPYAFDSIHINGLVTGECLVLGQRQDNGSFNIRFADPAGGLLVLVRGYVKRQAAGTSIPDSRGAAGGRPGSALPEHPFGITVTNPGDFDSIALDGMTPVPPGPGEVLINVVAAGLNFRDVLAALGELENIEAAGAGHLGIECAGVVSSVGENVEGVAAGDPVLAMAKPSFCSHVTVAVDKIRPVPPGVSFEEAAGLPVAFLTADYALGHLARLQEGERVLIHAATGGVGLAAVQLARLAGAEIYATAGRDGKREYLRRIGVGHVMDSRSLDFADEILEQTNGEGVDVVLNSLSGDYIAAGLRVLRPLGRFIEIGKRDIYSGAPLGLSPFRKNLAYFAVDLAVVEHEQPALFAGMFDALVDRLSTGALRPLPTSVVEVSRASAGFQRMARAEHMGKIVFTFPGADIPESGPARQAAAAFEFRQHFGDGIPLDTGMETFRRLLSSDSLPGYVHAVEDEVEGSVQQPALQVGGRSRARPEIDTVYRKPLDTEQRGLVKLWEEVLGIAPVGIDDDFFDIGGDSISAVQIQSVIAGEFGVRLSMDVFMEAPTVASLAEAIKRASGGNHD